MPGSALAAGSVPLVEATRGALVESVHHGVVAAVTADGRLLLALGDPDTVTFLRSTAKPFQALPYLERGGAEQHGLDDRDLALLCASHAGTDLHATAVARLQARTGVREEELGCGTHIPFDDDTAYALRRAGVAPGSNRHNCSGKHTGMLAATRLAGWSSADYLAVAHPLQQEILHAFAAMAGVEAAAVQLGIDGCSAPNFAVSVRAAAHAWARLIDPAGLPPVRAGACARLVQAMSRAPELVSGPGRTDTRLMQALPGRLLAKGGAEGCQALAIAPGVIDARGVGVFVKIADGDAEGRARRVLVSALLARLGLPGVLHDAQLAGLQPVQVLRNARGTVCGELRATLQPAS